MSTRLNFFFTEAIRSLSTNIATSVAATLSMLIALLVVGCFMILISITAGEANRVAQDAGRVRVFLDDTATNQDVNALMSSAKGMRETKSVEYVSKEDALKRAKKLFKDSPEIMQNLPGNPFPASVELRLKDPKQVEIVAARFNKEQGVQEVQYGGELTKKVIRGATVLSTFLAVLGIGLVIAATLLVANTIRLSVFARRREIEVMKLVGASNSFVRLPFMIEGFLCGLIASLGAIVALLLAQQFIARTLENLNLSSNVQVPHATIFLGLLTMGIVLGGFGSGMTIRKYLRV